MPNAPAEAAKAPPPAFEDTCHEGRLPGSFLSIADAQRILMPVGGESRIWSADRERARLRGLFKVRDWTPDQAVRIALQEQDQRLRIYVWGSGHGVAIFLHPAGAAYRVSQEPRGQHDQELRTTLGPLITTDDRRDHRLPNGQYQIRIEGALGGRESPKPRCAVVVTKGSVRLMTVPFDGPAKSLYIEAFHEASLRDVALFRAGPVPEETSSPRSVVLDGARPAQLPWKEALPAGAKLIRHDDGSVELSAGKNKETAISSAVVSRPGIYEAVFKIDEATPGAGLALLDEKGEPVDGIEFGQAGNQPGNQNLMFAFGTPREQPGFNYGDFENRPVALAGGPLWLRLVSVAGVSKCWVSGDGAHWGSALESRWRMGAWRSVALYAREVGGQHKPDVPRRIRLGFVQVRQLDGLVAAAPEALRAQAAAVDCRLDVDHNESFDAWSARIMRLKPPAASPSSWRYACTLQALSQKISFDPAEALLLHAVRDKLDELPTLEAKVQLLHDAALIWRFYQDSSSRQLSLWNGLGREALNSGAPADFKLFEKAYMETSLGDPPERSGPLPWPLVRDALCFFYAGHRTADLARLEHLVLFWNANNQDVSGWPLGMQLDRFLQFMNVSTPVTQPNRFGRFGQGMPIQIQIGGNIGPGPFRQQFGQFGRMRHGGRGQSWRSQVDIAQNLAPPLNRAAVNVLSELEAAAAGQQYADVARILCTSAPLHDEGLVPATDDDHLFVSFRVALRLLVEHHPELATALAVPVSPADQLKIDQIMARGDVAGVEALPTQYFGSPAAAMACRWLGDRALAAADCDAALSWYEEGCRTALPVERAELTARRRLVLAMVGSLSPGSPSSPDVSGGPSAFQPVTQAVHFGEQTISPESFEAAVRQQIARHGGAAEPAAGSSPMLAVPAPVAFSAAKWADFPEPDGPGYLRETLPEEYRQVQWSWQHLGMAFGNNALLVFNRAHIASFDTGSAKMLWSRSLGNSWSPAGMHPQLAGDRIYLRTAAESSRSSLTCLDARSGQLLWTSTSAGPVASDPLIYRGRLFVTAVTPSASDFMATVWLMEIKPDTGAVLSRHKVIETTDTIRVPGECQATWVGNRLYAAMSGSVVCVDLQGRVAWLRQGSSLPFEVSPAFAEQWVQPPAESAGRLFVQQPGRSAIECLSRETGELLWQRPLLSLRGMCDVRGGQLLAVTSYGLVALSATDGSLMWQRDLPDLFQGYVRTSSGHILCAQESNLNNKRQVVFQWLNAQTGRCDASSDMPLADNQAIMLGPWAAQGNRLFCCAGLVKPNDQPQSSPKRIIELRAGALISGQ